MLDATVADMNFKLDLMTPSDSLVYVRHCNHDLTHTPQFQAATSSTKPSSRFSYTTSQNSFANFEI